MRNWICSFVLYGFLVFIAFGCSDEGRVEGRTHVDSTEFTPNNTKLYSAAGVFKEQPLLSDKKVFTFVLSVDYKSVANYEIDECALSTCVENSIRVMCIGKNSCEVLSLREDNKYGLNPVQSVSISESSDSRKRRIEIVHSALYTKLDTGSTYKVRAFDAAGTRSETLSVEMQ